MQGAIFSVVSGVSGGFLALLAAIDNPKSDQVLNSKVIGFLFVKLSLLYICK